MKHTLYVEKDGVVDAEADGVAGAVDRDSNAGAADRHCSLFGYDSGHSYTCAWKSCYYELAAGYLQSVVGYNP